MAFIRVVSESEYYFIPLLNKSVHGKCYCYSKISENKLKLWWTIKLPRSRTCSNKKNHGQFIIPPKK